MKSQTHHAHKDKPSTVQISHNVAEINQQQSAEVEFTNDLLDTFLSCDIPLHKLKMDRMKDFLKKHIPDHKIPHPDILRPKIESLSLEKIVKIREEVDEPDVYFQIDGTSDCKSRNVVHIIVGKLNDKPSKPMLHHVDFQKVTNNLTIQSTIFDAYQVLYPDRNRYPQLKLLLLIDIHSSNYCY